MGTPDAGRVERIACQDRRRRCAESYALARHLGRPENLPPLARTRTRRPASPTRAEAERMAEAVRAYPELFADALAEPVAVIVADLDAEPEDA
jgi:hypothetical protein